MGGLRKKEEFLIFVGSLSKTLFGTATSEDIDQLNNNLFQVSKILHDNIELIKGSAGHMSTFQTLINSRLDKIVKNVKKTSLQNLRLIEAVNRDNLEALDFYANVTMQIIHLQQAN